MAARCGSGGPSERPKVLGGHAGRTVTLSGSGVRVRRHWRLSEERALAVSERLEYVRCQLLRSRAHAGYYLGPCMSISSANGRSNGRSLWG